MREALLLALFFIASTACAFTGFVCPGNRELVCCSAHQLSAFLTHLQEMKDHGDSCGGPCESYGPNPLAA